MGFFDELPDPPPRPARHRQPDWLAPPEGELPVPVALELLVGRSDGAAVLVGPLRVYSTGFELDLTVLVRSPTEHFFDPLHLHHERKEDVLRFGLAFADGSRGEVVRHGSHPDPPERSLMSRGGYGGDNRWGMRLWSWPLPPPGPVEVVCLWPRFGIPETRASFDAQPVLDAAARVERLWPDPDDVGPGATWVRSHHLIRGDG